MITEQQTEDLKYESIIHETGNLVCFDLPFGYALTEDALNNLMREVHLIPTFKESLMSIKGGHIKVGKSMKKDVIDTISRVLSNKNNIIFEEKIPY